MSAKNNSPGPNRVVLIGAGAIGTVVAASLTRSSGLPLTLIARGSQYRALQSGPLRLQGKVSAEIALQVAEKLDFDLEDTLLIMAVKAVDLPGTLDQVKTRVKPSTVFLFLQNGYGIRQTARQALQPLQPRPSSIQRAITSIGATLLEPGLTAYYGGGLVLHPSSGQHGLPDILQNGFISLRVVPDFARYCWIKLLVNSVVNPLSVVLEANNREIAKPENDPLKTLLLNEALAVAAAEGVKLELDCTFLNRFIDSDNVSSMLQDIRRGKPTENEFISGALLRLAEKHGIELAAHRVLYHLVRARELSSRSL